MHVETKTLVLFKGVRDFIKRISWKRGAGLKRWWLRKNDRETLGRKLSFSLIMSVSRLEFCVPFVRWAYAFDLKSQRCCKGNGRMAAWRTSVRAGRF